MNRDIQFFQQDANSELQELQNQLQADFQEKLNPVLEQVATEKGLHMLIDIANSGAVWANSGLDLTAEVIRRFDAAKPAVKKNNRGAGSDWGSGDQRPVPAQRLKPNSAPVLPFRCPPDRLTAVHIPILQTIERLCYRYPSALVDAVTDYEPGRRMVAVKNVTVNEDYFQGHFPGAPLLPAVLMIETLAQVATMLVVSPRTGRPEGRVYLRGVDNAKFRRQVVPGDRLRLEVTLGARRPPGWLARTAVAYIDDGMVAEAELLLGLLPDAGPAATARLRGSKRRRSSIAARRSAPAP